ncbi:MAG TPA: hypothetical protein VL978_13985 [Puia sp.]|nr:hypothetical protein [Puia sp.]
MENDHTSQIGDDMDYTSTLPFVKAFMTALAVGISDTVLCLAYNLLWRDEGTTRFFSSDIISVSSLIFGVNILFIIIGLVYFGFLQAKATGEVIFSVIFAALTVIGVIVATHIQRSPLPGQNSRFHVLLVGVILICGISASVGIPLLYHSRKFNQHIL